MIKEQIEKVEILRNKIDDFDEKIVFLLSERMRIAIEISELKENSKEAIEAKTRVQDVLNKVQYLALKKQRR